MNISIKIDNNLPIYEQIIQEIKRGMINKEILAGDMLPSIRSLARELEISIITTKRAYEELEKEELIYSVQGKGFYVKKLNRKNLREQQLKLLEEKMMDWIQEGARLHLTLNDMIDILKTLYEGGVFDDGNTEM